MDAEFAMENQGATALARVREVALGILIGEIDPLDGTREIVALFHQLDHTGRQPGSELFLVFRGIDSEIEEFAFGPERKNWDPGALARIDRARADYLERTRPVIMEACRLLLANLDG